MIYWFVYDTNGVIAPHSQSVLPIEFDLPTNTQMLGPYTDDEMTATMKTAFSNPQLYIVQNGQFMQSSNANAILLSNAQQAKIQQIWNSYNQTIASGFNITVGSTQCTFGWSTDDKTNLMATQDSITDGFLTFPINYSDINGHPVPISSQTDLDTIKKTASSFFVNQHQQVLSLVGQVQAATTVNTVNAIQWVPASY